MSFPLRDSAYPVGRKNRRAAAGAGKEGCGEGADSRLSFSRNWGCGPKYRIAGRSPGVVKFEPGVGGRIIETFDNQVFSTGTITAWNPPQTLQFEWRVVNFVPGESTRVEVLFESVPTATCVTIHHIGWAGLRADHPVRHG